MKVVAVIQARMGSTRLPGKVMADLGGHPVLDWCVRAALAAPGVDEVWVATSTLAADDIIARHCEDREFNCWRGSETDVLARFVGCAKAAGADVVLRLTGDCPFLDPQVIGAVVALQRMTGAGYCSNVSPRTYPDGLDVQAMTVNALMAAHVEAARPIDRDCVCTWIERNRSRFPAEAVVNPLPGMEHERWVLDTAEDYTLAKNIVAIWRWEAGPPAMLDIKTLLDRHPYLRQLNATHIMNERFYEALAEEPVYPRTYQRSQAQLEKARAVIPLGAQTFSKSHLQYPQPSPLFVTHGDGALVWDADGNEYVDLVSALLPNVLGYRDPEVDAAIRRQLASGISFSLATELEAQLAETLCRLIPCAQMVRFGKTGTDVTTAAVRLARAYTGRDRVFIAGGYHGWADWSVERNLGVPKAVIELSERWGPQPIRPMQEYAAVIVEPEGNLQQLQWYREMCSTHGAVLIFDEVITGFRFDLGGAQKLYGVTPDLACFGKAMANGMPLSALVGRREIMQRLEPPDNIFFSGTFFGEALSLAASIATIKKMEERNVIKQLHDAGLVLSANVHGLIQAFDLGREMSLSGHASLRRLTFRDPQLAALFRREMVATGTLIIASHNVCAALGSGEVKRVLKSYEHTLSILREAVVNGDVAKRLGGANIAAGVR